MIERPPRAARVIRHEDAERARRHERAVVRLAVALMDDDWDDEETEGEDGTD